MNLEGLFTRRVVTANPNDSLGTIAGLMAEHNVGSVVIVEKQRPVGILTDRDVALALGAKGTSRDAAAQTVMTRHVVAVPQDTGIFGVTKFMKDCGVRRLPVVDREDHVVGMVSLDDILRCLGRELNNLAEGLGREMATK
jgi:CBS domain-containing protein